MKSARRNASGDSSRIAVPSECNVPSDPSTLPRSAANKCQAKPDVFPRNSLKTNTRRSQQVTSFIDVRERALQISIRQYFQVEFAVTHSKQTIGARATRQFFDRKGSQVDGESSLGDQACSSPIFEPRVSSFENGPARLLSPAASDVYLRARSLRAGLESKFLPRRSKGGQ